MGGYGFYIWVSYAAAGVILLVNVLLPLREAKMVYRRLRAYYRTTDRAR